MRLENLTEIQRLLISHYYKIGDKNAFNYKGINYTGNQVAKELENESYMGIKMIDNILLLAIDLLSRGKRFFNEDKSLKKEL